MAKAEETANVSARLKMSEIEELERLAAQQPVKVKVGTLVAHIIREWLKSHQQPKSRSRQ